MGLFDFLTGSSNQALPQNQQSGLPPEHSAAARILELLGGMTGFSPLSAVGYLVDQPAEEKYNEAVWPRFKSMLAKSGVQQQTLDNLEALPMRARIGAANQLWQNTLKQKTQQRQVAQQVMLPSGQEENIDPNTGKVLSTLPFGAYTSGFKPPKTQATSVKTPFEFWMQANPHGTPQDWANFARQFKPTKDQTMDPATREAATTTARLQATQAFKNQQPFNQVDKENIPFMTLRDGSEVPIPTTTPYGQIVNKPGVFYLPKTLVTNGTYMRLNALPTMGQQLIASSKVLGSGGLSGLGRREYMKFSGDPSYSAYKTAGANYVDTVASVFSRRVSQSLIDSWREAIYGNFASPESVKAAINEINQNAATMKSSIRATGPSDSMALPPGLPDMSGVGTPVYGPDGKVIGFTH